MISIGKRGTSARQCEEWNRKTQTMTCGLVMSPTPSVVGLLRLPHQLRSFISSFLNWFPRGTDEKLNSFAVGLRGPELMQDDVAWSRSWFGFSLGKDTSDV